MKNEYGKNYYVVKADQVEKHFDDNGFYATYLNRRINRRTQSNGDCLPQSGVRIA